ncbi:MAG: NAD-binding protein [Burkholderiaceae bacterium]
MSDVLLLVLRRLRAPLLCLIAVYAISVAGLSLMPGEVDGQPQRLSIFHAFYIMSYTATTIGFGEVPHPFTEAQRMWVIVSIYLSVLGWAYSVGSVFALINDPTFRATLARAVFNWRVNGMGEEFMIVCGAGQSGIALAHALDGIGYRLVVIDSEAERAAKLEFEEFRTPPLVLCADARLPDVLKDAGIHKDGCKGLLAFVTDDNANQAIAIGAHTLNPTLRIVARAKTAVAQVNLEAFGGVEVINPFETFGTNVALDLASPEVLRLEEWLTAAPGTDLPERVNIPAGPWVLVGFGRFGHAIARALDGSKVSWKAIDPDRVEESEQRLLTSDNSESALREAGIEKAAVLVVGTDNDATNLGIVTLARRVNPGLFVVIRQNHVADRVLIQTAMADLSFVQSDVMVHESLQILKTPLLGRFISRVRAQGGSFAGKTIQLIEEKVGCGAPRAWTFVCDVMQPGMFGAFFQGAGAPLSVGHISRDPGHPDAELSAVCLMLDRKGEQMLLPSSEVQLKPGDQLLFVGSDEALQRQTRYLREPSAIQYVRTGEEPSHGYIFHYMRKWFDNRQRTRNRPT